MMKAHERKSPKANTHCSGGVNTQQAPRLQRAYIITPHLCTLSMSFIRSSRICSWGVSSMKACPSRMNCLHSAVMATHEFT